MIVFTDGGSRGNPGLGACGAVIKNRNGEIIEKIGKFLGTCTNNQAEYEGIILGIELAQKHGAENVEFLMDSELVVKQLNGQYRVKDQKLIPLHAKVKEMLKTFQDITFIAIPRERNKDADQVVNQVLDSQILR